MARYNSQIASKKKSPRVACSLCGKFIASSGLKNHVNAVHLKLRPHPCTFEGCKLMFATTGGVKAHRSKHTGEKIPCRVVGCPKGFADGANETRHFKDVHLGKKWICRLEGCSEPIVAPRPDSMKRHLERHHLIDDYSMANYEERNTLEMDAYEGPTSVGATEASATPHSSPPLLTPPWPSMPSIEEGNPADPFAALLAAFQDPSEVPYSFNGAPAGHTEATSMDPIDMTWFFTEEVQSKPTPAPLSDADKEAVAALELWTSIQGLGGEISAPEPSSSYVPMGAVAPMNIFLQTPNNVPFPQAMPYGGGFMGEYQTAYAGFNF